MTSEEVKGSSPSPNKYWFKPINRSFDEETGQALADLTDRFEIRELEPSLLKEQPQPGQVIELTGVSGSGKSMMLMHLFVCALLPKTWKGLKLSGSGIGVLFLACNSDFSIFQLENMLQKRVSIVMKSCKQVLKLRKSASNDLDLIDSVEDFSKFLRSGKENVKEELKNLVTHCLQNFLVLKVYDSTHFAVTMREVEVYFTKHSCISLMAIDSITAFYGWDCAFRFDDLSQTGDYYNRVIGTFLAHAKRNKIIVIASSDWQRGKMHQSHENVDQFEEISREEDEFWETKWQQYVAVQVHLSIVERHVSKINSKEAKSLNISSNLKEPGSDEKVVNRRTRYCASVKSENSAIEVQFTVHEEGIRWCS